MVIQPTDKDHDFAIVAEVKGNSKIEKWQIRKYQQALERNNRFQRWDKSRRYLIGVTNYRKKIEAIDRQIKWSDISQILSSESPVPHSAKPSVTNVYYQFRQFLEEWGLVPMKVAKIGPGFPAQWNHVHRLEGQLENILKEIRGREFLENRPMKPPHFELADDFGDSWLGIYHQGAPRPFFYIGFGFYNKPPHVILFVQTILKGDQLSLRRGFSRQLNQAFQAAAKHSSWGGNIGKLTEDGETSFGFARVLDKELDGNREAIVDWFERTSIEVLRLGNKKRLGSR